jgi:hypothetical protein
LPSNGFDAMTWDKRRKRIGPQPKAEAQSIISRD